MSIGLYDCDLVKGQVPFPNLELMKLSSYYKQHNQIVSLSKDFCPDMYTEFFLRKDYNTDFNFESIKGYSNLYYGGYAFSGDKYLPLPMDIELSSPDTSIYKPLKNSLGGRKKQKFETYLNGIHFRLSLDSTSVSDVLLSRVPTNKFSKIYHIHDLNVTNIDGAADAIKYLESQNPSTKIHPRFKFKFPLQFNNTEDFKKWNFLYRTKHNITYQYNGILTDEELVYYVEQHPEYLPNDFIYNICLPHNLTDEKMLEIALKIYKQVIFLRRHQRYFLLIMGTPFPFMENWKLVFDLWNSYLLHGAVSNPDFIKEFDQFGTLYSFGRHLQFYEFLQNNKTKCYISLEDARKAFTFIGNQYPELFNDFYTLNQIKLVGGEFECSKRIYLRDCL